MDHQHSEHVAAAPDAVFGILSDPAHLPDFVPQLTRAERTDADHVHVAARYDGKEHEGDAAFSADADARRITWGTPGGYEGWLQVDPDGDGSKLTLHLHTVHAPDTDRDVAGTLDAIRRLVESKA